MTAQQKWKLWTEQIPADHALYAELIAVSGNPSEIESRFGEDLSFGTAGLRGVMGAGTDRMNVYTVRRAALAYGQYIKFAPLPDTCAVAYDTRNNSRLFAEVCAVALAEEGIHVYLYPTPAPTPMLSFAVRHLRTGGGVVMTASHNPAAYNGMKCYGNDGCQQTDEPAAEVFRRMQALPMISEAKGTFEQNLAEGTIELLTEQIFESYYDAVLRESLCEKLIPVSGLKVLYTPLHGTGLTPVTALFDRLHVDYDVVTAQATPDGDFPTCPYPNPETAGAFVEAEKVVAAHDQYDLILATDPDSDRMAVAVPVRREIPTPNGAKTELSLKRLTGNELGCLLLDFILNNRLRLDNLPDQSKCIKSIVTTPMVKKIAAQYGCETIDVLTGFKYIGSTILDLEEKGHADEAVFAFEESCGFLKGTYVRDKDAQVACMLVCELAASCKLEEIDLSERLEQMYRHFGYYKTKVVSVELDGEAGKQKCADFIDVLRNMPPTEIAGIPVSKISDYQKGYERDCVSGKNTKMDYPKSNVLSFQAGDCGQVILRPSGTEPKLKIYFFAADPHEAWAETVLERFIAEFQEKMRQFGVLT